MSYLYPLLVVINIIGTLLTFPLALILPLFATQQEGWLDNATKWGVGPRLPKWLSWFQAPDNSLDGDIGFFSTHPASWWSKVQWLWRNPFYGFAVVTFDDSDGMSYSGDLKVSPTNPGHILIKGHGLWQYVLYKSFLGKTLYLNFGWNIMSLVEPSFLTPDQWQDNTALIKNYPATFAFSPRII
jgi:hypothetical protein